LASYESKLSTFNISVCVVSAPTPIEVRAHFPLLEELPKYAIMNTTSRNGLQVIFDDVMRQRWEDWYGSYTLRKFGWQLEA
jgi:hypothetical protein